MWQANIVTLANVFLIPTLMCKFLTMQYMQFLQELHSVWCGKNNLNVHKFCIRHRLP